MSFKYEPAPQVVAALRGEMASNQEKHSLHEETLLESAEVLEGERRRLRELEEELTSHQEKHTKNEETLLESAEVLSPAGARSPML